VLQVGAADVQCFPDKKDSMPKGALASHIKQGVVFVTYSLLVFGGAEQGPHAACLRLVWWPAGVHACMRRACCGLLRAGGGSLVAARWRRWGWLPSRPAAAAAGGGASEKKPKVVGGQGRGRGRGGGKGRGRGRGRSQGEQAEQADEAGQAGQQGGDDDFGPVPKGTRCAAATAEAALGALPSAEL
jgi:hypothetical protein